MFDIESILQVLLTGNMLPLIVLVVLALSFVIAVVILIVRLRTWPRYEAWEARKRRHVHHYADRTMPPAGDSLAQHGKFRTSWDKQPIWVKFWWMLTGVA